MMKRKDSINRCLIRSLSAILISAGILLGSTVASAGTELIEERQVDRVRSTGLRPYLTVMGEDYDLTVDSYLLGEEGRRMRVSELRCSARFGSDSHVVSMEVLPPEKVGGNRRVKSLRVLYQSAD